jgi:ABC-type microcin C transport system permease subunit YejE
MGFYVECMLLSDFAPNWSTFPNLTKTPKYRIQMQIFVVIGLFCLFGCVDIDFIMHTAELEPKNVSYSFFCGNQ